MMASDTIRKDRPVRTPIGDRNVLAVQGLKDTDEFVYRWVNEGNIDQRYSLGYDVVDKEGKTVGEGTLESAKGLGSALTKGVGQGVTAYLMKVPRDVWEARRKVNVDKPTDEIEAGLHEETHKRGNYGDITVNRNKK